MQKKVMKERIEVALARVDADIIRFIDGPNSQDEYFTGYRNALRDMLLLIEDVIPDRRNYWKETDDHA